MEFVCPRNAFSVGDFKMSVPAIDTAASEKAAAATTKR
jgi:hypothetical protein